MRISWILVLVACGAEAPQEAAPDDTGEVPTGVTGTTIDTPIPLCINEVMTDNSGALEVDGTWPDWIEIHNPSAAEVSLDGWLIHDEDGSSYRFTAADAVSAGGFLLLYATESDVEGHLPFKLNDSGDSVVLVRTDQTFIQVDLPASVADWSFARETDCCVGECWTAALWGTPGESNVPDEE